MGSRGRIIKLAGAVIAGLVLVIFIIWLIQVVVINGAALFRNLGETPIVTPTPMEEEVWTPNIEPSENVGENEGTPVYKPTIPENSDFDESGGGQEAGVPVDAVPEDLINTTPEPNPTPEPDDIQFFEPDESVLEDGF